MLNDSWCRHDYSAVVRDITGYDAVSPYAYVVADMNASDDFRPAPYEDVIADYGRALLLAAFEGVRAYCYLVEDCAVPADFSSE